MGVQNKVINSMAWLGVGQVVSISVAFLSNIVLARLLSPDDFGCIGMLTIFLSISAIFVNGGFGMALIQKKNASNLDCATVFWWNLYISLVFIVILFFAAPYIARFYGIPLLRDVLRVSSLDLLLTALAIVPTNLMKKHFQFKQLALRTIVSCIFATSISIYLAYIGFGIWSLVALNLIKSTIIAIMLWGMTDWRPSLSFSIESWKELFGFGGLMLMSSIINTIYININGLLIGKFFNASSLGYYVQAKKLEEVPTLSVTSVINEVSFSAFATVQDQKVVLINALRKNCICISFLCFPVFLLAIDLGPYLIRLLFGLKWVNAVPYFQLLCLGGMIYTLNSIYESVIKSLGKGKLYFVSFTANKILGLLLIVLGIPLGIKGMLIGMIAGNYLTLFVNMIINSKIVNYPLVQQIKDIVLYLLLAIVSFGIGHLLQFFELHYIVIVFAESAVFVLTYLLLTRLAKLQGLVLITDIIKSKFHKNGKHL